MKFKNPFSGFKENFFSKSNLAFFSLGILSGILQGLAWPTFSVFALNLFYFLPVFIGLCFCRNTVNALILGLGQAMASSLVGFYWIAHVAESFGGLSPLVSPFVALLFSLVGQTQYLLFTTLIFIINRASKQRLPLIFFPAFYVLLDFFYPKIFSDTHGAVLYPWKSLIQITEITGLYFLTFLTVFANTVLATLLFPFLNKKNLIKNKIQMEYLPSQKSGLIHCALLIALLSALHLWGNQRIRELRNEMASWPVRLKTAVIQANIGDADKLASKQGHTKAVQYVLTTYEAMTRKAIKELKPDLVIWPETAYPYTYSHFLPANEQDRLKSKNYFIMHLVDDVKTPLYFGGYSNDGVREYNSSWLVESSRKPAYLYRKSMLLAFGEYVPLGPFSDFILSEFPAIGNFGKGLGTAVVDFHGINIGPLICYETLVQSYVRDTVKKGAELLLNLTNDSWFGDTSEPYSNLLLTSFRSIEFRRPLLRSTNTGISAYINILGEIETSTKLFEEVIWPVNVRLPEKAQSLPTTFYQRYGGWFESLCFIYSALIMIFWTRLFGIRRERLL